MRMLTRGPARGLLLLAVLGVCVLAGCPGRRSQEEILVTVTENGDQGDTVTHDRLVEQAKAEGEVVWYTSLPDATAKPVLDSFRHLYPFVSTRLVRGSTFDIAKRADGEMRTAKVQVDVLHVLDVATFIDWKRRGELYRYVSAEDKAIPENYKDPGYWTTMRAATLCIAYNSKRVSAAEAPKSWTDLLDPKWQGRIGLKDAVTAGTAYAEYYFLRDLYGASYWHRISDQHPKLYRTNKDMLDALVREETLVASGVTGTGAYKAQVAEKQPVTTVLPVEGLPMMLGPVAIAANAPHPSCAKLFVDYVLSTQGQAVVCKLAGSYSVRADVDPPEGQKPLSSLKIMIPTGGWDAYYQAQDALQDEYVHLFHSGREGD